MKGTRTPSNAETSWKNIFGLIFAKIGKSLQSFVAYYFYMILYSLYNLILKNEGLHNLHLLQILGMILFPIPLTYLYYQAKKDKKPTEDKLDFPYELTFKFSGNSIYDIAEVISKEMPVNHYLEKLLSNITFSIRGILEENHIATEMICANIILPENDELVIKAFGPTNANRKYIKIPINKVNPVPGAPDAYVNNDFRYIPDTKSKKYRKNFSSNEYRSFFSIPITENEADGPVIAVINVDSCKQNQFVSLKFISESIFPALNPFLELIKILRKLNKI